MISKSQYRILLVGWLIPLITSQSCAGSVQPATPTDLPHINLATPINPQISPDAINPLVAESRLRFDSWSSDSQWIAYWLADGDDLPAHLAFINVRTNKICQHKEIRADGIESRNVRWLENGNAIVFQDPKGTRLGGIPCGVFSLVENNTTLVKEDDDISPNGNYRADTIISGWEEQLIHNVTTITEISTNQIAATVKWDGSPHAWAESGWLNNELYLVGLDIYQGALYVSALDGKVGNVVSDLLGMDVQDIGYLSRVGRYMDTAKGDYHLLIERSKESPLPLLLYHSELDLIEELPFYRSWIHHGLTFSSDGKWLFLFYPSSQQNETDDLWIRSVDPPENAASQLAGDKGFAGFDLSNEADKMAIIDHSHVYIMNFPDGEIISLWGASGYDISSVCWSPDGSRLAMQGFPTGSQPEALFVVEP